MRALAIQIMFLLAIFMVCNLASECYAKENIVLWLRFDEGKGDVAKDSSNYKHDGTITEAKWVEGKFGSALSFDGINDIVEVKSTNDLQLSGEGLTIAVWFKTTETVRADLMFIEKGAWDPGEYALSYPGYANKRVRFQIYQIYGKETSQIDSVSGVPELSDDEWHHAAGVYDAANHIFRVYVDGVRKNRAQIPMFSLLTTNQSLLAQETIKVFITSAKLMSFLWQKFHLRMIKY